MSINDKRLAVVCFNPQPRNQTVLEQLRCELYGWFNAPLADFDAPDGVNIFYLGYSQKRRRELEAAAAAAQGERVKRHNRVHRRAQRRFLLPRGRATARRAQEEVAALEPSPRRPCVSCETGDCCKPPTILLSCGHGFKPRIG